MNFLFEPPVIAAIVAAFVSFVTQIISNRQNKKRDFLEVSKSSLEYKTKQLDEFYGPLLALRDQNSEMIHRLQKVKGKEFRLIYNLPGCLNEPAIAPLVRNILKNNDEIESLLKTRGSLIQGNKLPESYKHELGHIALLRSAAEGHPLNEYTEQDLYRKEFSIDIQETFAELKKEVNEILENRDKKVL